MKNVAYRRSIYTSGSTGKPKGTLLTHRNALRLFSATEAWFGFDERDVWTLFHSYAFDFSVWEIFGALLYGGRLVIDLAATVVQLFSEVQRRHALAGNLADAVVHLPGRDVHALVASDTARVIV